MDNEHLSASFRNTIISNVCKKNNLPINQFSISDWEQLLHHNDIPCNVNFDFYKKQGDTMRLTNIPEFLEANSFKNRFPDIKKVYMIPPDKNGKVTEDYFILGSKSNEYLALDLKVARRFWTNFSHTRHLNVISPYDQISGHPSDSEIYGGNPDLADVTRSSYRHLKIRKSPHLEDWERRLDHKVFLEFLQGKEKKSESQNTNSQRWV